MRAVRDKIVFRSEAHPMAPRVTLVVRRKRGTASTWVLEPEQYEKVVRRLKPEKDRRGRLRLLLRLPRKKYGKAYDIPAVLMNWDGRHILWEEDWLSETVLEDRS